MENLIIPSNKNLEARLGVPENSKKAIIVAHSFRNTMDEPVCSEAVQKFFEKGYAVLSFNFLGHGNSEGTLRDVSYKNVAENISSAIDLMREKGFGKVGVYAISLGTIATVLSEKQPDAQVFLSASILSNPQGLLQRYSKYINKEELDFQGYCEVVSGSGRGKFQMGKEWIEEMQDEGTDIFGKVFGKLKNNSVPTLIIQGANDGPSRLKQVRGFAISYGNKYLEIKEADHNFTNPYHRKIVINQSLGWFNRML